MKKPVDLVVEKLQIVTPDMYRQMSPARAQETREVAIGMLEGVAKSFILDAWKRYTVALQLCRIISLPLVQDASSEPGRQCTPALPGIAPSMYFK